MFKLSNLLEKPKAVETLKSERACLLRDFIEIIDAEREGTKYKAVNPKFFAVKTSHLSMSDLRWLYSQGRQYNKEHKGAFSKFVFGSLKVKSK